MICNPLKHHYATCYESWRKKACVFTNTKNKSAHRPTHPHRRVSIFVVHCLRGIISQEFKPLLWPSRVPKGRGFPRPADSWIQFALKEI